MGVYDRHQITLSVNPAGCVRTHQYSPYPTGKDTLWGWRRHMDCVQHSGRELTPTPEPLPELSTMWIHYEPSQTSPRYKQASRDFALTQTQATSGALAIWTWWGFWKWAGRAGTSSPQCVLSWSWAALQASTAASRCHTVTELVVSPRQLLPSSARTILSILFCTNILLFVWQNNHPPKQTLPKI